MSKAFVKEGEAQDTDLDREVEDRALPPGTKNYITVQGAHRLREELKDLLNRVRPEVTAVVSWAASNGDRSENADYIYGKKRLREIDRRIRFLTKRLENAEILDPTQVKSDRVRFGATVTVRDGDGLEKIYSIVGIDEIEVKKGRISWVSPLGRALLNKVVGAVAVFNSPKGEVELEIVEIKYQEIL